MFSDLRSRRSLLITAFLVSLLVPLILYVGPIRLSPYRIVLIVSFIPTCVLLLSGVLGRLRADLLILLSAAWSALALFVTMGAEAVEPSGILVIETFGSYALGRALVRNAEDFLVLVKVIFLSVAAMLPFAAMESLTDRNIPLELFDRLGEVITKNHMVARLDLYRAQVVFEHAILYGSYCACALGLTYYTAHGLAGRYLRPMLVLLATIFSMSSGAITAVAAQAVLIGWDKVTARRRRRWLVLAVLAVAAYVTVDLLSNRTPVEVFISYLTLNSSTAYNRVLIWEFGIDNVLRHPLFGLGFADWDRPEWMSYSIDNFWLVLAMRHGLPTLLLFAAGTLAILIGVGRSQLADPGARRCRASLLVALGGLIIAGCTVHYWNAIFSFFMFLLGSGGWLIGRTEVRATAARRPAPVRRRYGRPQKTLRQTDIDGGTPAG